MSNGLRNGSEKIRHSIIANTNKPLFSISLPSSQTGTGLPGDPLVIPFNLKRYRDAEMALVMADRAAALIELPTLLQSKINGIESQSGSLHVQVNVDGKSDRNYAGDRCD